MNKCSVCSRTISNYENIVTSEQGKCIFHSKKNDWDGNETKILYFWEELRKYMLIVDEYEGGKVAINEKIPYYNCFILDSYIFKDFIFPKFDISNHSPTESVKNFFSSKEQTFKKNVDFTGARFLNDADFFSVKFMGICSFNNTKFDAKLDLSRCEFNKEFYIENSHIDEEVDFKFSIFKDRVRILSLTVDNLEFEECKFEKNVVLKHLELDYLRIFSSIFENKLTCVISDIKDMIIHFSELSYLSISKLNIDSIDFKGTLFHREFYFNEVKDLNKNNLKVENLANRETARIIKDSFEKQNNVIEANRFYALEIKQRSNELKFGWEKLVFWLHSVSSNHSQSWEYALFWIFIIGMFASGIDFLCFLESCKVPPYINYAYFIPLTFFIIFSYYLIATFYDYKYLVSSIVLVISICLYLYLTRDFTFELFAKTINPFSVMKSNEAINGVQLFFKILIAYLIYQFIISIRQNTRRK